MESAENIQIVVLIEKENRNLRFYFFVTVQLVYELIML